MCEQPILSWRHSGSSSCTEESAFEALGLVRGVATGASSAFDFAVGFLFRLERLSLHPREKLGHRNDRRTQPGSAGTPLQLRASSQKRRNRGPRTVAIGPRRERHARTRAPAAASSDRRSIKFRDSRWAKRWARRKLCSQIICSPICIQFCIQK